MNTYNSEITNYQLIKLHIIASDLPNTCVITLHSVSSLGINSQISSNQIIYCNKSVHSLAIFIQNMLKILT